jgi:putative tryptophan/tyrosine transport system substrate-binding protein
MRAMRWRRTAAWVLGASLILHATPGTTPAQSSPTNIPRIGVLSGGRAGDSSGCTGAFRSGLSALGYVERQTYQLEIQWSDGGVETFPKLAAELVRRKVDIIAVTSLAIEAAKAATSTIPLVMTSSSYPVERGLIASLARPGGNITGLATHTGELMGKRVQILKEAVPKAAKVAVLRLVGPVQDFFVRDIEAAAKQVGVQSQVIEVRRPEDLSGAFETAVKSGAQAVMLSQGPFFNMTRKQIGDLALKHRLPTLSGEPESPEAGTLLFYGPDIYDGCGRAASYVDRILKGAKPADLPVEQPNKYELVINLKTAKALGLTVPQSLVYRADRVIE